MTENCVQCGVPLTSCEEGFCESCLLENKRADKEHALLIGAVPDLEEDYGFGDYLGTTNRR